MYSINNCYTSLTLVRHQHFPSQEAIFSEQKNIYVANSRSNLPLIISINKTQFTYERLIEEIRF